MCIEMSEYTLKKWSAYTRVRDNRTCQLCLNCVESKTSLLQAHHVFQKETNYYPKLYGCLGSSISLCNKCHLRITHSDERNVRRFRFLFYSYLNRRDIKEFNMKYQYRISNIYLISERELEEYGISKGWIKLIMDPLMGYKHI